MVWGFLPTSPSLDTLPPLSPLLLLLLLLHLHFRSHPASYNWPSRLSLLPLPVLYKITLVTTVSARQGGLIRPLGVLTSLGRTNRFNSLPSRYTPRTACTMSYPSPAQWFRNCRFAPSSPLSLLSTRSISRSSMLFFASRNFLCRFLRWLPLSCGSSHFNLTSCELPSLIVFQLSHTSLFFSPVRFMLETFFVVISHAIKIWYDNKYILLTYDV